MVWVASLAGHRVYNVRPDIIVASPRPRPYLPLQETGFFTPRLYWLVRWLSHRQQRPFSFRMAVPAISITKP